MKEITGLDTVITEIDGETAVFNRYGNPLDVKTGLAGILVQASSADPARAMKLAVDLQKAEDSLEVESADLQVMLETVKADRTYTNLVRAAVLNVLEAV